MHTSWVLRVLRGTEVDRSPRHRTPTPRHVVGPAPGLVALTTVGHHVPWAATGDREIPPRRWHCCVHIVLTMRKTGPGAGRPPQGPGPEVTPVPADAHPRRFWDGPVELVGGGSDAP